MIVLIVLPVLAFSISYAVTYTEEDTREPVVIVSCTIAEFPTYGIGTFTLNVVGLLLAYAGFVRYGWCRDVSGGEWEKTLRISKYIAYVSGACLMGGAAFPLRPGMTRSPRLYY